MKLVIVKSLAQLNPLTQDTIKSSSATSMLYVNTLNERVMVVTAGYLNALNSYKWACGLTFTSLEIATNDIEISEVQYLHARVRGSTYWAGEYPSELLSDALLVITQESLMFNKKEFKIPKDLTREFYNELEFVLEEAYSELDVDYWVKLMNDKDE